MRRTIKELFQAADKDRTGILTKGEFTTLIICVNNNSKLPSISKPAAMGPGAHSPGKVRYARARVPAAPAARGAPLVQRRAGNAGTTQACIAYGVNPAG